MNAMSSDLKRKEPLDSQGAESAQPKWAQPCVSFATMVHTTLPRELRDQIYDYLWTTDCVDELDSVISCHPIPSKESSSDTTSSHLPVPCFADAAYVGDAFAREAATWYFRMSTNAEINYRHVRGFLELTSFGSMAFPPQNVIRCLIIDIEWSIHRVGEVAYASLRDSMSSLLALQDRDDLHIEIYLSRDLQFSRALFRVLDIIAPVFHALAHKGPEVKVMGYQFFTPRWRDALEPTARRTHATVELLNCYFSGPPEAWLAMKAAELETLVPLRRRQMCCEILDTMRKNAADRHSRTHDPDLDQQQLCMCIPRVGTK